MRYTPKCLARDNADNPVPLLPRQSSTSVSQSARPAPPQTPAAGSVALTSEERLPCTNSASELANAGRETRGFASRMPPNKGSLGALLRQSQKQIVQRWRPHFVLQIGKCRHE